MKMLMAREEPRWRLPEFLVHIGYLAAESKYLVLVYSFCLPTLSLLRALKGQGKNNINPR